MKNKNKLVCGLIVLFVIVTIAGLVLYKLETRQVYILDIPNSYNLSSISYELESGSITVMTEKEMDKVLNGIYALNLSTKSVSVQDYPADVENLVSIRFYYKEEDSVGNIYIYKKKNKYYLEEPYNGVYKITDENYNYIINLVKEQIMNIIYRSAKVSDYEGVYYVCCYSWGETYIQALCLMII